MKEKSFEFKYKWLFFISIYLCIIALVYICNEASGKTWYVDDDGGKDYEKIQDAINAAKDEDIIYVHNGIYYENVEVNKKLSFQGEERNNTIINGSNIGNVVNISIDGVIFRDLSITYSGPTYFNAGIYVNSNFNTITGCNIYNNNDSGIYFDKSSNNQITNCNIYSNIFYGIYLHYSNRNIITNCNLNSHLKNGIELWHSSENQITNCEILSNKDHGIEISGLDNIITNCNILNNLRGIFIGYSDNNQITNCDMSNKGYGISLRSSENNTITKCNIYSHNGNGINLAESNNNTMTKLNIYLNNGSGIFLDRASYNLIDDSNISNNHHGIYGPDFSSSNDNKINKCIIYSNSEYGIYIGGSDNNFLSNSSISNNTHGIYYFWPSKNNIIYNCDIYTNIEYGIYIGLASNNKIINCNISNNLHGIYLYNSNKCQITNCSVYSNADMGIRWKLANDNKLTNCNIYSNNFLGIRLESSSNNIFSNCNISLNNAYGIKLQESSNDNMITNCSILNNDYGIYIYSTSNNNIIYNNYLDNTNNVWDSTNNIWNLTKTPGNNIIGGLNVGGNYWSDYSGVDLNKDGFGDTPHPISGGSDIDWLPLAIKDSIPPIITNVNANPNPQETGRHVNISFDVMDNVKVNVVKVNITSPNGSTANITISDESYFYNTTYSLLGIYNYFIWANDTSNNVNTSTIYFFTINDTTPPKITNVSTKPNPQEIDGYVNISCDVIDNVKVNNVKININYPDSSINNVTMSEGSYYYNTTYSMLGTYKYFIWANDTNNNTNVSAIYFFTIQDIIPPKITNGDATPNPQETGGDVNISCDVTDNVKVNVVKVNVTYPDGSKVNKTMSSGGRYYYNITYSIPGTYYYFIWVSDLSNNKNLSLINSFTIIKDTINKNPIAYIDKILPNPLEIGQAVTFEGHGVDEDGTIIEYSWNSSIDGFLNNEKSFTLSNLSNGIHIIYFKVRDDFGVWSETVSDTLTINKKQSENKKPTAFIDEISPNKAIEGEKITFKGRGVDIDGTIVEYSWRSSRDGILNTSKSFTKLDLSVGVHIIYFKVQDNNGTWSEEVTINLTIKPKEGEKEELKPSLFASKTIVKVGETITFDASNSTGNIVAYFFDFGDSTNSSWIINPQINHTFSTQGNYLVKLKLKNTNGNESFWDTVEITVEENEITVDEKEEKSWNWLILSVIIVLILIVTIIMKGKLKKTSIQPKKEIAESEDIIQQQQIIKEEPLPPPPPEEPSSLLIEKQEKSEQQNDAGEEFIK